MKSEISLGFDRGNLMTLLKRHRLAHGWTQGKLGAKVDRTAAAVSAWESGKNVPDPDIFPKLARVLGIDAMELTKVIEPTADRAQPV